MLPKGCPKCRENKESGSYYVRSGFYYRTSDAKRIQRFRCQTCWGTCSTATFRRWFRQKKRLKNAQLRKHFASSGTIRRAAETYHLNRKTVAKKLVELGFEAEANLKITNLQHERARVIEFDDLETFEHTKCKPLSVTLAVQSRTRRILGIEVSRMPAKGMLVEKAKKYGPRIDERALGRKRLFTSIVDLINEDALIKSDSNPHYPKDVKRFFPKARHVTYEGKRGSLGGQGELKKVVFDPLYSLNHTCAMFRANVSRLVRKTWNTTKRSDRLRAHLYIFADYHNDKIERARLKALLKVQ